MNSAFFAFPIVIAVFSIIAFVTAFNKNESTEERIVATFKGIGLFLLLVIVVVVVALAAFFINY